MAGYRTCVRGGCSNIGVFLEDQQVRVGNTDVSVGCIAGAQNFFAAVVTGMLIAGSVIETSSPEKRLIPSE